MLPRASKLLGLMAAVALLTCGDDGSPVDGGGGGNAAGAAGAGGSAGGAGTGGSDECGPDGPGPNEVLPDPSDPEAGDFTLAEALAGLPEGPGPLRAIITTPMGEIVCELLADVAPGAVANFAGLARGTRAWRDPATGKWVRRRFYDGLTFHRVIPEFMIQGGDPKGDGTGGPGFTIKDEVSGLSHDPGTLSYAKTSAPNSQGSQFFITETAQTHLDPDFTIFGRCQPVSVVTAIAAVPTDASDKPLTPVTMDSVEITRCAP